MGSAAEAPAQFRFEAHRDGGKVAGHAYVVSRGKEVDLGERAGEVPSKGLLLNGAGDSSQAVVLWLDGTSGKQGRAVVYSLPAGQATTTGAWFERPGLEPGEAAGRFAITTPLKRLDLSPPWLRASHGFEAAGGSLRSLGTSKPAPATADQELEWADDELVADHPDAALEGIGHYLKAHEADVSRQSELAIALGMTARAYVRLGKPAALISVLSRLQRDFAATPEGRLASEALDFIAKKGVDAYLKREK